MNFINRAKKVAKKFYGKILNKRKKTKEELFLESCKKYGIFSPFLESFCKKLLIPHPLTVKQFARHLKVGKRVLDVGSGMGILTRFAFDKGAEKVVAIDINPVAVESTRQYVPEAEVLLSDLFENVKGTYNTIIFNAPWADGGINAAKDYAIYDCNNVTERFLNDVKQYLVKDGHIWLQYADAFSDKYNKLHMLIQKNGFKIDKYWFHTRWGPLVKHNIKVYLYKISST